MSSRLFVFLFISIVVFTSCARIKTLNTRPHQYNADARNIVWVQLLDFSSSDLLQSIYQSQRGDELQFLEQMDCHGWIIPASNKELLPSSDVASMMQISGTIKDLKNCSEVKEFSLAPFINNKYELVMLEDGDMGSNGGGSKEHGRVESLSDLLYCTKEKHQWNNLHYINLSSGLLENTNLVQIDSSNVVQALNGPGGELRDRQCSQGPCKVSPLTYVKALIPEMNKKTNKQMVIAVDRRLVAKNFSLDKNAKQKLKDLIVDDLLKIRKSLREDSLLLISLIDGRSDKNSILAAGASSENFCGSFSHSAILKRLLYENKRRYFNIYE